MGALSPSEWGPGEAPGLAREPAEESREAGAAAVREKIATDPGL